MKRIFLLLTIFFALQTAGYGQQFVVCEVPDTVDTHGQDLCLLRLSHYTLKGDTATGVMIVSRRMADATCKAFRALYNIKYPVERMELAQGDKDDEASMRANNTSGYLFRTIAGTRRLSKHARGLALDLNPLYTPCLTLKDGKVSDIQPRTAMRYANRRQTFPCTVTPQVVAIFKGYGFAWGGDWRSKKDYQHFEFIE